MCGALYASHEGKHKHFCLVLYTCSPWHNVNHGRFVFQSIRNSAMGSQLPDALCCEMDVVVKCLHVVIAVICEEICKSDA